jgi:hypothetical protein
MVTVAMPTLANLASLLHAIKAPRALTNSRGSPDGAYAAAQLIEPATWARNRKEPAC